MNQHQITLTAGDERTLSFIVDDEYEADTARFIVDGLFEKSATVGADDGSGYATVSFTIDEDDTSETDYRRAYFYQLRIDNEGATTTIRRGLFVVTPGFDEE